MSFFGQLFGGAFALVLLAIAGFVFWPADSCQRTANAATIVYGALGTIPLIGERALDRDMTRQWHDVEQWSSWVQERLKDYFGVSACERSPMDLYGRRSDVDEAADWLRRNDPELYRLLEGVAPSADQASGDRL